MNYNTDRAITRLDEDLLGRASFSQQLGKAIHDYRGKDSLVIGLYGKWGTGKTSVANMALQTVEELSKDDKKPPVVIRFAPWNYSDKDNLISQFFSSLRARIDLEDNEEIKNKVGKALSDYSKVFELASLIPIVGGQLAPLLRTVAELSGEALSKPKDLNASKKKLEEALLEVNQKIIILIDDIDRLTNSQIRDIFQLVKQVGDLPNITYLLVMDRGVVRRALSEVHNLDGNEYLEKIIQIPFEIPELRKIKLHDIFFSRLNTIIGEISDNISWDQQYFNRVFSNCIDPYVLTLRDVNRVLNTFQFRYSMLYEETALEDMLGITTLEVLRPELYKWIAENKEAVCGGMLHGFIVDRKNTENNKKRYEADFLALDLEPEQSILSLAAMFPVFAKDVGVYYSGTDDSSSVRAQMRAAQDERFDLYFMFDINDIKVRISVINACIYSLDKDGINKAITEVNNQGNIVYFIEEIRARIDKIPDDRLALLATCFIENRKGFKGNASRAVFSIPASELASYCFEAIIKRIKTNDERFEVYKNALINADYDSIDMIAQEIRKIRQAYADSNDTKREEEQLISKEQLNMLEKLFLDRIKESSISDYLMDMDGPCYAFYLWEDLESDAAQKYINNELLDDVKKLKFISRMAGKWHGTNGEGWSFKHSNYSEYASEDEVYKMIMEYDKKKLDTFTKQEQIILASFVLNYNKEDYMHATEQQAEQLVGKWKSDVVEET